MSLAEEENTTIILLGDDSLWQGSLSCIGHCVLFGDVGDRFEYELVSKTT